MKNAIGRRRLLRGMFGASLALPFLPSLLSRTEAQSNVRRRFAIFVRSGNGVQQAYDTEPERFWPRGSGVLDAETMRDRAVEELLPHANRISIVKGIDRPFTTPSCGHSESIPQCLTACEPTRGIANDSLATSISADWRIANQLTDGVEPLTLMAGPTDAYIGAAISWRGPHDRAPAQRSPALVYAGLMGLSGLPEQVRSQIIARRRSVNDLVRDEMTELMRSSALSGHDRRRLQQHFDVVRDTEIAAMSCSFDAGSTTNLDFTDFEANDVRVDVARSFMDLIALAMHCGTTPAATLQIGEGNDQTMYEIGGRRYPRFHHISHRINSDGATGDPIPDAVDLHHNIDRLHLGLFGHLLDRLAAYESPYGGQLIDDGVAVWMNDLGAGPPHSGSDVPWIFAGSCGGQLRVGQFVQTDRKINHALNTVLTAVGCTENGGPVENFGDASLAGGRIDELVMS